MASGEQTTVVEDAPEKEQVKNEVDAETMLEDNTGTLEEKLIPKWWHAMCITYAITHPHVRARLEKLMGSGLVRLTNKHYMAELQKRIVAVNEENLNRRIADRELNEMERLKRQILCGKTPLSECPPELFHHSVFVFWRMVEREVALAKKKREEAYLKKIGAFRNKVSNVEEEGVAEEEEVEKLSPEQLLALCREELAAQKDEDMRNGFRMSDDEFARNKYEDADVKRLRAVTTVEELYMLADQIIGVPRTFVTIT